MAEKSVKSKKKPAAKRAPKAAPKSATKRSKDIDGPQPMSKFDYDFCQIYVQTGKMVEAYRQLLPEYKDPSVGAHRMMQRPEIRDHIKAIFRLISKQRQRAAELSARAALLTLEVADDRLLEVLQARRRTRGEMLSRDVKQLLIPGATPKTDDMGNEDGYQISADLQKSLEEGAPVEDADLLKAIKLTYERKQGIIKAEKPVDPTPLHVHLYRPQWRTPLQAQPMTIEAES